MDDISDKPPPLPPPPLPPPLSAEEAATEELEANVTDDQIAALEKCIRIACAAQHKPLLVDLQGRLAQAVTHRQLAASANVVHLRTLAVERRRKDDAERRANDEADRMSKVEADRSKAEILRAQAEKDRARVEALQAQRAERQTLVDKQKAESDARRAESHLQTLTAALVGKVAMRWLRGQTEAQKTRFNKLVDEARKHRKGIDYCRVPEVFFDPCPKCPAGS